MSRIHIIIDAEDKLRYEAQAAREGMSLGAWLREAAEERYQADQARRPFRSAEEVRAFFNASDRRETSQEPDWEDHQRVLDASRRSGLEPS